LIHPVELLLELWIGREIPGHGVSLSSGGPVPGTHGGTPSIHVGSSRVTKS
jgi:hypothetical protein